MALVIQSGEDEDIPEPPSDFPRCGSLPMSAAESYISGAAAVLPDLMSGAKEPEESHASSHAIPPNPSATSGIAFGSLQVLFVVGLLLIIVASAIVALPVYMVRSKRNMSEVTERTHLLEEEDVAKI